QLAQGVRPEDTQREERERELARVERERERERLAASLVGLKVRRQALVKGLRKAEEEVDSFNTLDRAFSAASSSLDRQIQKLQREREEMEREYQMAKAGVESSIQKVPVLTASLQEVDAEIRRATIMSREHV
ncbi:hypothetical protein KIPB_013408, partial [Kipferlia bialata]